MYRQNVLISQGHAHSIAVKNFKEKNIRGVSEHLTQGKPTISPSYEPMAFKFGTEVPESSTPKEKSLKEIVKSISVNTILEGKAKNVVGIKDNAMVYDAIKLMSTKNVGCVVVSPASKDNIAGIFTERDYVRKIIVQNIFSKNTPVNKVMTKDVVVGNQTWSIVDCINAMVAGKFRHLPILPNDSELNNGKPIGVISSRDVMKHLVKAVEESNDVEELKAAVKINDVFNKICRKSARTCYVQSHDTVLAALQEMYKHNLGALFVNRGTEIVGIFTERDYLHKVILQGKLSKDTKVKEVMTKNIISVGPMDSALSTLKLMVEQNIRNIPVIPMLGRNIDYADGKDYATIGMLNEVDFIKYAHTKLSDKV